MKCALSRMIVPVPVIVGLGLTGCTVMTKQEHMEMHREIHKEMMNSEAHKNTMREMMKEMMTKKKEIIKMKMK